MSTPLPAAPSRERLTPIQLQLATFVYRFILDNRYCPSLSECAEGIGKEESATADHLKRLYKKGVLGHKPKVARAMWVEDGWGDVLGGKVAA